LSSYGPAIEIFDEDVEALRETNEDSYQIRVGGYMELTCWNTKNLGRCILPSVTF
jgi:hypothetical protein